jgi:hypothetical protein
MELSTASEATCSSALPPVVSTLPFPDAPLAVDALSTDVAAAASAALGNGVTIPLTAAAGMMKLKVMGTVKVG